MDEEKNKLYHVLENRIKAKDNKWVLYIKIILLPSTNATIYYMFFKILFNILMSFVLLC